MITPELERLREEIEKCDRALIEMIAERVRLAREVGKEKLSLGLPTLDSEREGEVLRSAVALAREVGLECDDEIREIFRELIELSKRAQGIDSEDGV